jgi:hypothetical protein
MALTTIDLKRQILLRDARISVLEKAIQEACDLLAERAQGSPARSAGHNARVRLEAALAEPVA